MDGMTKIALQDAIKNRRDFYAELASRTCCDKCRSRGRIGLAIFEPYLLAAMECKDDALDQKGVIEGVASVAADMLSCVAPDQSVSQQIAALVTLQTVWANLAKQGRTGNSALATRDGA